MGTTRGRKKRTKPQSGKVDIGSAIRDRLNACNQSVVWFASILECSRTNVYKIFNKKSISTEELFKISEILNYDFFKLYSNKLNRK